MGLGDRRQEKGNRKKEKGDCLPALVYSAGKEKGTDLLAVAATFSTFPTLSTL